jgi:AcrR family transcriptional regulator
MQHKGFDEISVQDVTEAATVNRATFYDHYTDKFALLDAMVGSGFHSLLHERNVRYDGTCASAAGAIVLAACDYLSQNHANTEMEKRQNAFEPLIDAAITHAIRRVLTEGMPKTGATSGLSADIIATSTSWAIYGAVREWFKNPDRPPAEEIVPLVVQFIAPILQAAAPLHQSPIPQNDV